MPVLSVDADALVRLVGRPIPRDDLIARVPMMGGAFDGEKDGELLFEFFPNRPDLLSLEGLARAVRAFFDVKPGLQTYDVAPPGPDDVVTIDPSVVKVRPFIAFARVTGVHFDDEYLADIIDLQERLTTGPGRKRKKVAVGVHDAARVRGPFTYKAVKPGDVRFVPLQMSEELTPAEILEKHEKGRLYRHLVGDRVPLITDRDGQVLSMPPVINGALTALTTASRDVLVDVTGTDERATMGLLNILVTSLAERGGKIQALQVVKGKTAKVTPDLTPQETTLPLRRVKDLLGLRVDGADLKKYLGRMGHDVADVTSTKAVVRSPAWRMDILHPDDIVEDVGIGYGFDAFTPRLPTIARFGTVLPSTERRRKARTSLLGLAFTEVVTLTITSRVDVQQNIRAPASPLVEVLNPATLDQSVLRPQLFTSLLALLRANRHRELPQSVFEVGIVVPPTPDGHQPPNQLRAAAARIAPRASFAECKGLVETFLRDMGLPAKMEPANVAGFVAGRAARLTHDGRDVGFFGEVDPATITAFELGAPVLAFEVVL